MTDETGAAGPSGAIPPDPAPAKPDKATALATGAVDKGAPWKRGTAWWVVLTEGVVAAVIGVLLVLTDLGTNLAIELLGVLLLVTSLLSVYQLFKGQVAPGRVALVAFRSGAGVTTGVLVLIGSIAVGASDPVTRALAVVLGVGLVIYGLVGLTSGILRREAGQGLPIAVLIIAGGATLIGLLLTFNGIAGYDEVKGTFKLLGILLIVAGGALAIYGYVLRGRQGTDPTG
jgi:hypothetical protein